MLLVATDLTIPCESAKTD